MKSNTNGIASQCSVCGWGGPGEWDTCANCRRAREVVIAENNRLRDQLNELIGAVNGLLAFANRIEVGK